MSAEFRPIRALPASPSLEQQKKQARELLRAAHAGDDVALRRARAAHPRFEDRREDFALSDAHLVLAREYGFASWPKLKFYIESVVRPGPRRPYVTDPAWYEARAAGLVEMHRGALPNALAQIRAWHPAFAHASDAELASMAFTIDDARLVYARQNGTADWKGLVELVASLAESSDHSEPSTRASSSDARTSGAQRAFARAFAAIEKRSPPKLRELLSHHPDLVDDQGTNGNTLLNLAVSIEKEFGPMVSALLDAGAEPNLPNDRGWTPLHQAAGTDDASLVMRLLDAGAAVTLSAHGEGGTPLSVALWWGKLRTASTLAEVAVVPDNLRVRAALGHVDQLGRFFIANGTLSADAGAGRGFYRPHSGFPAWTPSDDPQEIIDEAFAWAARNDAVASMEWLAARGANCAIAPCRGTPLMFAVAWRKPAAARWLLDHGVDPNRLALFHGQEKGRVTALHLAAQTDDIELVRMLLDHGADRTTKDENYQSDAAGWARYTDSRRTLALLSGQEPINS